MDHPDLISIRYDAGEEVITMAKNSGKGYRKGAVKGRSEIKHPNGSYIKRNTSTGRFMNVSDKPHKGVRDEK